MDEQPDVPEVQPPFIGTPELDSEQLRGGQLPAGDGGVPLPWEDQPGEVQPVDGLDGDQGEEGPTEIQTWYAGAERVMLAWWHDPRTALKYSIAVMRLLQTSTLIEVLATEPGDIPPITEREVGWT